MDTTVGVWNLLIQTRKARTFTLNDRYALRKKLRERLIQVPVSSIKQGIAGTESETSRPRKNMTSEQTAERKCGESDRLVVQDKKIDQTDKY